MVKRQAIPLMLACSTLLMAVLVRVDAPIYRGILFGEPVTIAYYDIGEHLRILFPNSLDYLIVLWLGSGSSALALTGALLPLAYGVGLFLNLMVARFGLWKTLPIYLLGSFAFACAVIYVSWRYLW